jgi:hypothetical protein
VVTRRETWSAVVRAPSGPEPAGQRDAVRARFTRELASAVAGQPHWRELVVTMPMLRRALSDTGRSMAWDEPFRWKPLFVRRSLGLAAIEACWLGRYRSPAQAVGPVADDAVATWQRSGWRRYHWEPWLSYQPPAARAVVLAEAARWATSLWCAFDWAALGPDVRVGGPDEQWRCPPNGTVRLRGRVDLRVPVARRCEVAHPRSEQSEDHSSRREALVVTSAGVPPPTWETDLAFPALVAALCRPRRPVPCRVMGIWPDAGLQHTVEIGGEALGRVAGRVVAAVATMVRPEVGGYAGDPPGVVDTRRARAAFGSGLPAAVSGMSSTRSS